MKLQENSNRVSAFRGIGVDAAQVLWRTTHLVPSPFHDTTESVLDSSTRS